MAEMFFLKIRGVNRMPDFVQIRDADFTLVAYFRADKPETARILCKYRIPEEEISRHLKDLPYGKLKKVHMNL